MTLSLCVTQQFKIDCSFNSNLNGIKVTKFFHSPSTRRILDWDADKKKRAVGDTTRITPIGLHQEKAFDNDQWNYIVTKNFYNASSIFYKAAIAV